jgi:glycosyltransferase involved in cell wall biosynthesis
LATNSPNKLFDSLSAGKPIIVNSAGWTKDMVEQENCGFYVDVEKPEMLAEKLLEYKDQKELLEEWGKNARRLSVEVYDKAKLSAQVADVLETTFSRLKK